MSKTLCPARCGKKFINAQCANAHADAVHPAWRNPVIKRKGWMTPYGFADFKEPVTYEEACNTLKAVQHG